MPQLIPQPMQITAAGNKPKQIREYIGRMDSQTAAGQRGLDAKSAGWQEPGQRPEFDEYTIVLKGRLRVESDAERWSASDAGRDRPAPANGFVTARPDPRVRRIFRHLPPGLFPGHRPSGRRNNNPMHSEGNERFMSLAHCPRSRRRLVLGSATPDLPIIPLRRIMSDTIQFGVNGAAGRMGQRIVALAAADSAFRIAAAFEAARHPRLGQDAGELAGVGRMDVPVTADIGSRST